MTRQYPVSQPWGRFHTERFFCVTADQDWAPEWATSFTLEWARNLGLSVHVFQTNESLELDRAKSRGEIELGWHPNFLVDSTHGETEGAVVQHMRDHFPGAKTFRSHSFCESFGALEHLRNAGIEVDSQFPTAFSGFITPLVHATGIVRLPVWFEDDVWMRAHPLAESAEVLMPSLDTPGLKILNLHPVHIALNCPTMSYYDARRSAIYVNGPEVEQLSSLEYSGYGVRNVAEEILANASADQESIYRFSELSDIAGTMAVSLR